MTDMHVSGSKAQQNPQSQRTDKPKDPPASSKPFPDVDKKPAAAAAKAMPEGTEKVVQNSINSVKGDDKSAAPEKAARSNDPNSPDNPRNPNHPDHPNNINNPDHPNNRDKIKSERESIQREGDNINSPDNPRNPNHPDHPNNINNPYDPNNRDKINNANTPDNSKFEALNNSVSFDKNAGFGDPKVQAEYQKTLETLYEESPTFKAVIDNLSANGNTITYTRQPGQGSHNVNSDGANATVNIDENAEVSYVAYDPSTQDAYVQNEASRARLLVHETIHAATGLSDLAPLPDYIDNLKSLESGQNLLDVFSEGFDGTEAQAIAGIAPGPVVRLTNQILNESTTHHEDPRVDYNAIVGQSPEVVQLTTTVLDGVIDEDFSTDKDYDLLFWDPTGQGQRFQ